MEGKDEQGQIRNNGRKECGNQCIEDRDVELVGQRKGMATGDKPTNCAGFGLNYDGVGQSKLGLRYGEET